MKPFKGPRPPAIADRPKCAWCKRALRPFYLTDYDRAKALDDAPRYWTGRYHSHGNFCTWVCAVRFANAAYRIGYRRNTS